MNSHLDCSVCGELSFEFPVYLVLEESKPAVKVQDAAKRPEVTDKTKKLEKRITPQEETKPGIQTAILKEFIPTPCVFLDRQCVLVLLYNTSIPSFFILEVTRPQPVMKPEEPTKAVAEEEKTIVVEKTAPVTGRGI